MAERRMFAKTIIDSDAFLDMSASAQALYFHLGMRADDDGFVNNPKKIQRIINASDDDLKILFAKRFIIGFETGVIVIKHWKMHNYIQRDRYKPTVYQDEKARLITKDNKSYTEKQGYISDVSTLDTVCIQDASSLDTQVRLGKDSIGKDSIDNPKDARHKYGLYNNVLLTDEQLQKLKNEFADWQQRIERLSEYMASTGKSYKDHLATIRAWARKEPPKSERAIKVLN